MLYTHGTTTSPHMHHTLDLQLLGWPMCMLKPVVLLPAGHATTGLLLLHSSRH